MTMKLLISAMTKMVLGVVLCGLFIFVPAGTIDFLQGWILMTVLFVPMFVAGIVLMIKNPALLKRRLNAKETQKEQHLVVILSGLMFVLGFLVAGLDYRFGLSRMPKGVMIGGVVVFLVAYGLYAEVLRENTYLSRTIEVQEGQKVVDTGLYGIVRHPMYAATVLLFLSMPVILGSYYAFAVFLFYPVVIVKRIQHEEFFLENKLYGYKEYKQKVTYRLIPFVW